MYSDLISLGSHYAAYYRVQCYGVFAMLFSHIFTFSVCINWNISSISLACFIKGSADLWYHEGYILNLWICKFIYAEIFNSLDCFSNHFSTEGFICWTYQPRNWLSINFCSFLDEKIYTGWTVISIFINYLKIM